MFILYPVEGLANRMRAIDSAVRYCRDWHIRLSVRWWRDPVLLNAQWGELFQPQKGFRNAGKSFLRLQFFFNLKRHSRLFSLFLRTLEKLHILRIFGPDDWAELRAMTATCGKERYWITIAQSFSVFYRPEGTDFLRELFVPAATLQQRIDEEIARFNDATYGVHIRRTDNKVAIQESPLELFRERITTILLEQPNARFYVCSDDASVKAELLEAFGPEVILLPDGTLNRNSKEGVQQAIVELFSLAATKRIIGSYFSSFSETAAELGGIPLEYTVRK